MAFIIACAEAGLIFCNCPPPNSIQHKTASAGAIGSRAKTDKQMQVDCSLCEAVQPASYQH